jgi:glycosyltransferase involved in cell wall biosynthesis
MKISLVVPAFNEERLLAGTLENLRTASQVLTQQGWETELIVCDNNSSDQTAAIARAAGAQVVFEPVNQIARARNTGAAAAVGDWLIFVDADSYPTAGLFAEAAAAIRQGDCLAGGATLRMEGANLAGACITRGWNLVSRTGRWLAGSFIFVEAAAFRQVGGFNDQIFAGEEVDLTRRLKRLGRASERKVVILHRHPLLTSARKLHLYSKWAHTRLLLRLMLNRGTMTRREGCELWYDGKR